MKPLFDGLFLIFIFFFTETETSRSELQKIKKEYTAAAAAPDNEACRDDHGTIQDIGTPEHEKKPRASPSRWDGFELARSLAQTGGAAHDMFVDYYREKGRPNPREATLNLYDAHHVDNSYHSPEEQVRSIDNRFDKARRTARKLFVQQDHQQLYQLHRDFQDHSGGTRSSSRSADYRYQNQNNVRHQSRNSGSSFGNNQPDASPPKTPLDDSYSHLDVQPPQYYLDLNLTWVPNKSPPSGGNTGGNTGGNHQL